MRICGLLHQHTVLLLLSACTTTGSEDSTSPAEIVFATNATPRAEVVRHTTGDTAREGFPFVAYGRVTDADTPADQLSVRWQVNGVDVCTHLLPNEDGEVSCEVTPTTGPLALALFATDPSGNEGSDTQTLTVTPTDAPEANLQATTSTNDRRYANIPIRVTGQVRDSETPLDTLAIVLTSDIEPTATFDLTVDASGALSAVSTLIEGDHTLTLTVTDETGKFGRASARLSVGAPNQPPACHIITPTAGLATETGQLTELLATASDPDIESARLWTVWSSDLDGILAEGPPAVAQDMLTSTILGYGQHTLSFQVTDEVGASCVANVIHTVGDAPVAEITAPLEGETVNEGEPVSFIGRVSDREDGPTDLVVEWTLPDGTLLDRATPSVDGTVSFTTDTLPRGASTVTLTAIDTTGFRESHTVEVVVNGAPSAPALSLSPSTPTTANDLTVSILVDAIDPEGEPIEYRTTWYKNGHLRTAGTDFTLPARATTRGETWTVSVVASDGLAQSEEATATVTIQNTAPVGVLAEISPATPTTADALVCVPSATDLDGDSVSWTFAWSIDGIDAGIVTDTLPGGSARRGQAVACSATPFDGASVGSSITSTTTIVANAVPNVASIGVAPQPATSADTLDCTVLTEDADHDFISTALSWWVNGVNIGVSDASIAAPSFVRGDTVFCAATPFDGWDTGATVASVPAIIQNGVPSITNIHVTPSSPTVSDALVCAATTADPDNDPLTVTYAWTVNGIAVGTGATLAPGAFSKGDLAVCTVEAADGITATVQPSDDVPIANTPPTLTDVDLSPATARAGDTLVCTPIATDADNDTLSVTTTWRVNGVDVGVSGDQLAGMFAKGDNVQCSIVLDDGDATVGPLSRSPVTIANTPPYVSTVNVTPPSPTTDQDLSCVVTGGDIDGDPVSYTYEWKVDGLSVSGDTGTLSHTTFSRGQQVTCAATPHDGILDGAALVSAASTVANSPPVLDAVSISPAQPTQSDTLTCTVSGHDEDGDEISYTYAWSRNHTPSGVSTATLDPSLTQRGDLWSCTATPNDGTAPGASASSADVMISNAAPEVLSVVLSSLSPSTDTTLTAIATTQDTDGDSVSVSWAWKVNGTLVPGATSASLSGLVFFDRGDTIEAIATPDDGSETGAPRASATATVGNAAPTAPIAQTAPAAPTESDDLVCVVDQPSTDADGDPITYTVSWDVDGAPWTGATYDTTWAGDTISAADTQGDETWTCTMTPNDGRSGGAATSVEATILPNQRVYFVEVDDLINQRGCGGPDTLARTSDGLNDWGFSWTDIDERTPISVAIDFSFGMVFGGDATFDTYLNGTPVDTVDAVAYNACPLSDVDTQPVTVIPSTLVSYLPNDQNELMFPFSGIEGLYADATGAYAIITVDY